MKRTVLMLLVLLLVAVGFSKPVPRKPSTFFITTVSPKLEPYLLKSIKTYSDRWTEENLDTLLAIVWQESSGNGTVADTGAGGVVSWGYGGLTLKSILHMAELYPTIRSRLPRFTISWEGRKKLYNISKENERKLIELVRRDAQLHFDIVVAYLDWCFDQADTLKLTLPAVTKKYSRADLALISYNWGIGKVTRALKNKTQIPEERFTYVRDVQTKVKNLTAYKNGKTKQALEKTTGAKKSRRGSSSLHHYSSSDRPRPRASFEISKIKNSFGEILLAYVKKEEALFQKD